jgi:hypothetical protein
MLMSKVTDPGHCAPRKAMGVIKVADLSTLSAAEVLEALEPILPSARPGERRGPDPKAEA